MAANESESPDLTRSVPHAGGAGPRGSGESLRPGILLGGRYRIVGLAGRGGMGEVYEAEDLKLDQRVGLKCLPPEMAEDEARLTRLFREVRIAREVSHPNVCRVYDIEEAGGRHFLSMEFIDGETLDVFLRRKASLPESEAVGIARQICAGLAAVHARGVLHRDLKPSNIMIDRRGVVRVTDFGMAEAVAAPGRFNAREGTPLYMAPEQVAGEIVSVGSDLYALGLVLYEVFCGRKAFDAKTLEELVRLRDSAPPPPSRYAPGLDPSVDGVVLRCLDNDPLRRPASAVAVAGALPGADPMGAAATEAQRRVDRITAFRSELAELRRDGVIQLSEEEIGAMRRHHESVIRDLVSLHDVDLG